MSEEIKEILRTLKAKSTRYEYCLKENISYNDESYEAHLLLDYITNLQQKVEQLENIRKEAIEYIKEKQKMQYKFALSHIECDDLLNILNKGSE